MSRRAQTVSALAVAAALIAGFGPEAQAVTATQAKVMFGLLVLLAIGKWLRDGWTLGKLSKHVAQIEFDINELLADEFIAYEVMTWETSRQRRHRLILGHDMLGQTKLPSHRSLESTLDRADRA